MISSMSSVLDSMQTTLGNLSQTSGSMAQVFDGVDSTLDTLNMSMTQLKGVIESASDKIKMCIRDRLNTVKKLRHRQSRLR